MLASLSDDLDNERLHMLFYAYAASAVTGPHRAELGEFFEEQAASELGHVKAFQDLILELGGVLRCPTGGPGDYIGLSSPDELLRYAVAMEDNVVANYVARREAASHMGGVDWTYLVLFLEDQITDSKSDAANMRRMIFGA